MRRASRATLGIALGLVLAGTGCAPLACRTCHSEPSVTHVARSGRGLGCTPLRSWLARSREYHAEPPVETAPFPMFHPVPTRPVFGDQLDGREAGLIDQWREER